MPLRGLEGAVHPVTVELPGLQAGHQAVPDMIGALEHRQAQRLRRRIGIEEAEIHAGGVLGKESKIDAEV